MASLPDDRALSDGGAPAEARLFVRTHVFSTRPFAEEEDERVDARDAMLLALARRGALVVIAHAREHGWDLGEVSADAALVEADGAPYVGRIVLVETELDERRREALEAAARADTEGDPRVTTVVSTVGRLGELG